MLHTIRQSVLTSSPWVRAAGVTAFVGFAVLATLGVLASCGKRAREVRVIGESTRWRVGSELAERSPWFDGTTLTLIAARGEVLGIQVIHGDDSPVTLTLTNATVRSFAVDHHVVRRRSTKMYGGSQGTGEYVDGLTPTAAPTSDPAYFEIAVPRDAAVGETIGSLMVGDQRFAARLVVAPVTLQPLRLDVWAYFDQRELRWSAGSTSEPARATVRAADAGERACIDLMRDHGVLLAPDMYVAQFATRRDLLFDFPYVPALLPLDPREVGSAVRAWIAATAGTNKLPFAIPIDEPRDAAARARVRQLADAVRAAGGGPTTFLYAVTDMPRPEYGDAIDLYIDSRAAHLDDDRVMRWTYNGAPPRAGSMVLDAATPGMRTWGWIAHRWRIPVWYVWDALYWHDRHNAHGGPPVAVNLERDAVSFDDGNDWGNFDGVLALPGGDGCRPTLRLAALRRGLLDRQLLELASRCAPQATEAIARRVVPRALADADPDQPAAWSSDEAVWEEARRQLIGSVTSCTTSSRVR